MFQSGNARLSDSSTVWTATSRLRRSLARFHLRMWLKAPNVPRTRVVTITSVAATTTATGIRRLMGVTPMLLVRLRVEPEALVGERGLGSEQRVRDPEGPPLPQPQ